MNIKHTLLLALAASLALAPNVHAQRYTHLHFDSAAIAVSISYEEYHLRRDSIRRAGVDAGDVSADWTGAGRGGWTEHRDPQKDGATELYWTDEDAVYARGGLIGMFWGLAIPDSSAGFVHNYKAVRWLWEPGGEGAVKATAWYCSVIP